MEAIAEDALSQFDRLGLTPSYNPQTNNFESEDGVPVRHVVEKKIKSRGRGGADSEKFDLFTGIIDGVTGEPLYGTRHYALTGEIYEGKFRAGLRHGDSAIVKFIQLPPPMEIIPSEEIGELAGMATSRTNLSFGRANFFGHYHNDEPSRGLLVTDVYTYRGSFQNGRFHGLDGELIHSNGYKYKGEFQDGRFHGMGREYDPSSGEYQGEFRNGMHHGMGTFKGGRPSAKDVDEIGDERSDDGDSSWDHKLRVPRGEDTPDVPSRYTYSGYFHGNMRQGEGTEWTPTGEIYTGHFLSNNRHGHGSLRVMESGITYEGKWRAGEPIDGNGWRLIYPNGDTYCGHAIGFLPDGYGIYRHHKGDVYSGDWRQGRRHGNGIHSHPSGVEFAGEWKDGVIISKKRLEATDGTLSEIAETLRIKEDPKPVDDGNTDEQKVETGDGRRARQLSFLKQAMAKSIETSLQIIAQNNEDGADKLFSEEMPAGGKREVPSDAERARRREGKAELHTYANGDTYLGALDEGTLQRTGYGVYVSRSTGCTYTGQFRKNRRHGYGILIHSQFGKYAGDFCEDRKHGRGTLILSDSSSYHGGFANGAFDGKGTLCERDGTVYVGEWKAGLRNGDGMETMSDGRVYKGFFKGGKREGSGTLLEKSAGKVIFNGQWRDGKYHGDGILVLRRQLPSTNQKSVIRWEGSFANGRRHGYGVMCNETEGTVYKGVWSNGSPQSGKWRIEYADGGVYSGHAQVLDEHQPGIMDAKIVAIPEGFGTFKYSNGDCYAGTFELGVRCGTGTCQFATGETWEGDWTNDHLKRDGQGVLTLPDGTVHEFTSSGLVQFLNRGHPDLYARLSRGLLS